MDNVINLNEKRKEKAVTKEEVAEYNFAAVMEKNRKNKERLVKSRNNSNVKTLRRYKIKP